MKMMSSPRRLHPAAVFFNLIKSLREMIFLFILGFITFREQGFLYFLMVAFFIVILMILFHALAWYRFTYRVEENELRIEYGIFIRRKRYISKNRIQSIDLTAGVIHRIFKLVKVQIETAGSGTEAEGSLSAVTLGEGERLRSELKQRKKSAEEEVEEAEENNDPSFTISFKRLFLAGSTSSSIGIILAFFVVAFSEIEQFIPDEVYSNAIDWVVSLSLILIAAFIVFILIMIWLLGIAGTMIKYGNFTITNRKSELFITRGLLEKKQITIPLNRIQAVGIQESMIRQPLGYAAVFAEVAGGSQEKGEDFSTILFPMIKKTEIAPFLQEILPGYAKLPEVWEPLPKKALKYYLFRSMLPFILLGAAVIWFFPSFIWLAIILFAISFLLGWQRYKDGGFALKGNMLMVKYRVFGKNTMLIYHRRIQAFEKKQHLMHRRENLATMELSIIGKFGAGKHYKLKEMKVSNTDELSDWYSYRGKLNMNKKDNQRGMK
ncbi:PH domain-containing protein [Virgibacillus sp. YIM 98842]|uniref:PH domain-containing protein n=1 Tax=Virgibacillus sp. YIM 98842 TaxID=2663533 RepID=UPI001F097423|nr:PH domain-containing protein [Virgibacillus sp. YIM 98842]